MTLKYIWRSFQPRLSFPRLFQQSLACFRVARSPSNSWDSCLVLLIFLAVFCVRNLFPVSAFFGRWIELCIRHVGFIAQVRASRACNNSSVRVHAKVVIARNFNKKAVLSQRWPRNAPYIRVPWKISGLPDYAHGHYSEHFHGLLFRSTL